MLVLDENALTSDRPGTAGDSLNRGKKDEWYKLCCLSIQTQSAIHKNTLLFISIIEYLQLLAIAFLSVVYFAIVILANFIIGAKSRSRFCASFHI